MQDSTGHPQSRKAIAALFNDTLCDVDSQSWDYNQCERVNGSPRLGGRWNTFCEIHMVKRMILRIVEVIAAIALLIVALTPSHTPAQVFLLIGSAVVLFACLLIAKNLGNGKETGDPNR
jgi:hypothetical protein